MWRVIKKFIFPLSLAAIVVAVPAHALKEWSFSIPSSSSGSFTATEAVNSVSALGDFTRLSNQFIKMTVTSASGTGAPMVGEIRYAIEVPGFSFISKPFMYNERKLIAAPSTGYCPTTSWTGILVYYIWAGTTGTSWDVSSATTPAFGVFTWNPATNQATVSDLRNLTSYGTLSGFGSFALSGTCTNGVITFTGAGDRGGKLFISSNYGGVYTSNTERAMYIIPQLTIPSASLLNGTYAAFSVDNSDHQIITGSRITFTGGTSATGDQLTDIDLGTTDTSKTWSFSSITINSPVNGMFTANLDLEGGTASKVACAVYFRNKTLVFCAAQDPSANSSPLNFAMVSDNQAFSAGALDTYSFGSSTGRVLTSMGTGTDTLRSLVIQPDGKLVAFGQNGNDSVMARYHFDGSLDTTFATAGRYTATFFTAADEARSVDIQSDGKLVFAGYSNGDFNFARLTTSGALDSTFDSDGRVSYSHSTGNDNLQEMHLQSDGKPVAAGYCAMGSNDMCVMRLTTSGALDTTFDTDGRASTSIGTANDRAYAMAIQSDGKIVAAGYTTGTNDNFALVRYLTNGALDTTFDTDGRRTVTVSSGAADNGRSVIQQMDGKLVLAGYVANTTNDFALVRFTTTGGLDTTFDTDGIVMTSVGTGSDRAYALAQQTDGKLVAVGWVSNGSNDDFGIVRYLTNGAIDSSFDSDGKIWYSMSTGTDDAYAVVIQSDGRIVVGGVANGDFGVLRVWP